MQKGLKNTDKISLLYDMASDNNIPVDEECPESIIAMSVRFSNGKKVIALTDFEKYKYSENNKMKHTKLECFAHEMGHCMTESFYAGYSSFDARAKHEYRANKWATDFIIPFEDLCEAVKNGIRETWALAEHFGVSQSFIEKAITIHAHRGNTVPTELYAE